MNVWNGVGRLTGDPELRHTPDGKAYTNFRVAVVRTKEITDFIPIAVWGERAEFVCKYFTKGKPISISGSIRQRDAEVDGKKRTFYEINAYTVEFVPGDTARTGDAQANEPAPAQDVRPRNPLDDIPDESPF